MFRSGPRAEIATANDFVLLTAKGKFLVRASDLWARDFGPPSGLLGPVPADGPVAAAIRRAGLDPEGVLYYRELVVFPGDAVSVTGVVTEEPAPPELARSSYRGGSSIPTLSGGGGALVIEVI